MVAKYALTGIAGANVFSYAASCESRRVVKVIVCGGMEEGWKRDGRGVVIIPAVSEVTRRDKFPTFEMNLITAL